MNENIESAYNKELDAVVVRMPEDITLDALSRWKKEIPVLLKANQGCALLLDTNTHNFESIDSLRLLREILEDCAAQHLIFKVAFVTPRQFREPGIQSSREAYFETFDDAAAWLASQGET
jgi:hypothetical protein